MAKETLLFEPKDALFAANNGLKAYEEIISQASGYLKKEGYLLLEIGFKQKESCVSLLNQAGFLNVAVLQDLAGFDRVIAARR